MSPATFLAEYVLFQLGRVAVPRPGGACAEEENPWNDSTVGGG